MLWNDEDIRIVTRAIAVLAASCASLAFLLGTLVG